MKINSVEIRGLHNAQNTMVYTLKDLNYLHGKNGAGKSTVIEAIQLGILGYLPGQSKTPASIMEHSNGDMISIVLKLSNGVTIKRKWVKIKSSVTSTLETSPEDIDPKTCVSELELPVLSFSEFVSQSANAQKQWFINYLPSCDSEVSWIDRLLATAPEHANEEFIAEIAEELEDLSGKGVEKIVKANKFIKSKISEKKVNISDLSGAVSQMVFYDDDTLTEYTAESVQTKLDELNQIRDSKLSMLNDFNRVSTIRNNMATLKSMNTISDEEMEGMEEELIKLTDTIQSVNSEFSDKMEELGELKGEIAKYTEISNTPGVCPLLKKQCEELAAMVDRARENVNNLSIKHTTLSSHIADLKRKLETSKSNISDIQNKLRVKRDARTQLSALESQLASYSKEVLSISDGSALTEDIVSIDSQISELRKISTKLAANEKYNELVDALTSNKYKCELELECLKVWEKLTSANGLQTALMEKPFEELSQQMSVYTSQMFGSEVKAHFKLTEKANSFNFGIIRGENYLPFSILSSGEKCMFVVSLMTCLSSIGDNIPLRLVLIDDLFDHLDNANIESLISSIKQVKGVQFVIAGVKDIGEAHSDIIKEIG